MAILYGMLSRPQIIDALGGYRQAAEIAGVPPSVAHKWRERGIPARYWPDVAAYARKNRIPGVTLETLKRPMWQREGADA